MKNCFRNIQDHFCCVRKIFCTAWHRLSENRWSRIIPYLFLMVLTLLSCWVLAGRHGMFASNVDWISQHSVFPDYFRQQFYETGKLFSEFAANIGGGQNIYYFSYYGLYSPILLPAYFLPFVKMSDYLICVSILCLAASVMLLYGWLKTCGFPFEICLSCAVMFLLASPMIYQSYRQVMFVNYMPFLCIALIGIERYWKAGKIRIYTAGVFLMVMTSFYFQHFRYFCAYDIWNQQMPESLMEACFCAFPAPGYFSSGSQRISSGSYSLCIAVKKRQFQYA